MAMPARGDSAVEEASFDMGHLRIVRIVRQQASNGVVGRGAEFLQRGLVLLSERGELVLRETKLVAQHGLDLGVAGGDALLRGGHAVAGGGELELQPPVLVLQLQLFLDAAAVERRPVEWRHGAHPIHAMSTASREVMAKIGTTTRTATDDNENRSDRAGGAGGTTRSVVQK